MPTPPLTPLATATLAVGRPESALVVECGEGEGALFLAREFPRARVRGVDTDAAAIRRATGRIGLDPEGRIAFKVGGPRDLPFPEDHFDLVAVLDGRLAAAETARVLRPGGFLVIAYTERLMNTYSQLATSQPVLQELAQQLNLANLPSISAQVVSDTELMQINVEGADPAQVTAVANGLAQILVARSEDYAGGGRTAQVILSEQLTQAEDELNQAQLAYVEAVGSSPADSARVAALSRAVDLKQEVYTALLQQYERTRVAEELRTNALTIVEPATLPREPSKPNTGGTSVLPSVEIENLAGRKVVIVQSGGQGVIVGRMDIPTPVRP